MPEVEVGPSAAEAEAETPEISGGGSEAKLKLRNVFSFVALPYSAWTRLTGS